MSTSGVPPANSAVQPARRKWRGALLGLAFVLGLSLLLFVIGAAVMFFQWPPSEFLEKAFVGCRAWYERSDMAAPDHEPDLPLAAAGIDKPQKTSDGYMLVTFGNPGGESTQAYLLDMKHKLKHRWSVPFSKIWPRPQHVPTPVKDELVTFFACHLYPNGDLLVVLHGLQQTAVGYGLVKLDKDSNILWSYAAGVHHNVDVDAEGNIYAIQHEMVKSMPEGLQFIPTPCLSDSLIVLNPDGTLKGKPVSVLEAFRDSPYLELLHGLEPGKERKEHSGPVSLKRFEDETRKQDAVHTNSIQRLTPAMAQQIPGAKAGQVLITLRNLDAIAVVDLDQRTVVWAARGPWQALHDAQVLDNGNLLLFDNQGLPKGSRVLEYNPRTQAFPWSYSGENLAPFFSSERGMCQRLPNGNTLVVNSIDGEIVEVTREKEVVWSYIPHHFTAFAHRYTPEQVPFLPAGTKPRP